MLFLIHNELSSLYIVLKATRIFQLQVDIVFLVSGLKLSKLLKIHMDAFKTSSSFGGSSSKINKKQKLKFSILKDADDLTSNFQYYQGNLFLC